MFSVVMATRNRPALFAQALASVRMQAEADFEIIVVMDGSAAEHDAGYAEVLAAVPEAPVIRLDATARGHGQSYAINRGAAVARGAYLCFIDDDDVWTDPRHLARAAASLADAAELYLADQAAFRGAERVAPAGGVWPEALGARPGRLGPADSQGAHRVGAATLMAVPKHCHLNTTIIRRALFAAIGGMDEDIRYDCDRDFYLRAVDAAAVIRYAPVVVARHNIPDPRQKSSMSTATPALQRLLYQRVVFDKAILFARQKEVRAHAVAHQAYVLRHITAALAGERRFAAARSYAWAAFGLRPTPKWLGYCAWLSARALLARA